MAKVAFLGLGVMGYPMAGHLKNKGGHEVTVYNRNAEKAAKWAAQFGGKTAATPKEAAEGQDFVMMCVGNDNDVREVALGANGAYSGMKKRAVFVDHTTASAEVARELGINMTGGSTSVADAWEPLRWAAASARAQLVAVAAARWQCAPQDCSVKDGVVWHAASSRTYWRSQSGVVLPCPAIGPRTW